MKFLQIICMMKCTHFQCRPEFSIQELTANKHPTQNTELSIYMQHQLHISAENPWLPTSGGKYWCTDIWLTNMQCKSHEIDASSTQLIEGHISSHSLSWKCCYPEYLFPALVSPTAVPAHGVVWHGDVRMPVTLCHHSDWAAAMGRDGHPGMSIKPWHECSNLSAVCTEWPLLFYNKLNSRMKMKSLAWRKRKQAVELSCEEIPFCACKEKWFFQGHRTLLQSQSYRTCKRICTASFLIKHLWQLN